jgi:hypothetical protein
LADIAGHPLWSLVFLLYAGIALYQSGINLPAGAGGIRTSACCSVVRNSMNKIKNRQAAAATLQSTIRRKTDMMKQRQLVDETKLKQMEATKDKAIKDDAAKKLQASLKRATAQDNILKINKAKDRISAASKRLLTEKVDSFYGPMSKTSFIMNAKMTYNSMRPIRHGKKF